jgi:hypothetical protein
LRRALTLVGKGRKPPMASITILSNLARQHERRPLAQLQRHRAHAIRPNPQRSTTLPLIVLRAVVFRRFSSPAVGKYLARVLACPNPQLLRLHPQRARSARIDGAPSSSSRCGCRSTAAGSSCCWFSQPSSCWFGHVEQVVVVTRTNRPEPACVQSTVQHASPLRATISYSSGVSETAAFQQVP